MVVVPQADQISTTSSSTAEIFFDKTFGALNQSDETGKRIFNAFLAISSLGNIIVMTYTAARVKQEIAKEGLLPWPKFFAQNRDMSLGRLLRSFQKKGWFSSLLKMKWFSPEEHREQTPVGAFVLHFGSCLVLIFATWGMSPDSAYALLTNLSAYTINAFFAIFLGLGILILRIKGPPALDGDVPEQSSTPRTWKTLTGKHINPVVSVVCAFIYMIGGLYPVVATWIKPSKDIAQTIEWYLTPAISWAVIGAGVLWFLGFVLVAWHKNRRHHKVFLVEKEPEFENADGFAESEKGGRGSGGLVLVHETVCLSWVGRETLRRRRAGEMELDENIGDQHNQARSPEPGRDFDSYYPDQQQPNGFGGGFGGGQDTGYGGGYGNGSEAGYSHGYGPGNEPGHGGGHDNGFGGGQTNGFGGGGHTTGFGGGQTNGFGGNHGFGGGQGNGYGPGQGTGYGNGFRP